MAISRYSSAQSFDGGVGNANIVVEIRKQISSGLLNFKEYYLTGGERLDVIAGKEYGDSKYWWLVAAASDVGWGMQVPPGTRIRVPELTSVMRIITT